MAYLNGYGDNAEPSASRFDNSEQTERSKNILPSETTQYKLIDHLEGGIFGLLLECRNLKTKDIVVIKMMEGNRSDLKDEIKNEVKVCEQLRQIDVEPFNIVKVYEIFFYLDRTCIAFEKLEQNLEEHQRYHDTYSLQNIRIMIKQVLIALKKLKEMGLVYCDLRPDNIMFVDVIKHPYKIKLIDFGTARPPRECLAGVDAQYLDYRAPEVVLGLPFDYSIDIWSVGCITAQLFLGFPLYPAENEFDLLRYITQTQGPINEDMLDDGRFTSEYYDQNNDGTWVLKPRGQYTAETGRVSKETRLNVFKNFKHIKFVNCPDLERREFKAEMKDRTFFVNFIEMTMTIDPENRASHEEALSSEYIKLADYDEDERITMLANLDDEMEEEAKGYIIVDSNLDVCTFMNYYDKIWTFTPNKM